MNNWLQEYLADTLSRKLCTRVNCTTCGAREFRNGLTTAAAHELGRSPRPSVEIDTAIFIGCALAKIAPDSNDQRYSQYEFEAATRLILVDTWNSLGHPKADEIILPLLVGSWTGDLLERMKVHYAARLAQQGHREEYESPERVIERREAKRRLKQEGHAARIAAKHERDNARNLVRTK